MSAPNSGEKQEVLQPDGDAPLQKTPLKVECPETETKVPLVYRIPPEEIPEDERFQYDEEGVLLGAAFDEELFGLMTGLSIVMNPEWQLLLSPQKSDEIQLAYRLSRSSIYWKLFEMEMFKDSASQTLREGNAKFRITKIDVIENPFVYSQYYLKWQELRRRNGTVYEMMAYCVGPSYEDVVMGDLLKSPGSDCLKFSANLFPLIKINTAEDKASVSKGILVYCKVLISKTGKFNMKPTAKIKNEDTLASADGLMKKFAPDEIHPICMIHYKLNI